jgi:hypothetical protein
LPNFFSAALSGLPVNGGSNRSSISGPEKKINSSDTFADDLALDADGDASIDVAANGKAGTLRSPPPLVGSPLCDLLIPKPR